MARGGQNLKSKAIQTIKRELEFRTCASGEKVPVSEFPDWCRAMNTLLCIRIIGVSYLRYAAKQLATARTIWKKPKEQEALNAVAGLLIQAEQRCADRASKRAEKRLLRDVVEPTTDVAKGPGRSKKGTTRPQAPPPELDAWRLI